MSSSLEQIFYISRARPGMTDADARMILGASMVGNRRRDLTGMLAYSGLYFGQVLEGRSTELEAVLARIRSDERHCDVRIIHRKPIKTRDFAVWSMGFVADVAFDERLANMLSAACTEATPALDFIRDLGNDQSFELTCQHKLQRTPRGDGRGPFWLWHLGLGIPMAELRVCVSLLIGVGAWEIQRPHQGRLDRARTLELCNAARGIFPCGHGAMEPNSVGG